VITYRRGGNHSTETAAVPAAEQSPLDRSVNDSSGESTELLAFAQACQVLAAINARLARPAHGECHDSLCDFGGPDTVLALSF
jgi:hypothetical protein